MTVMSTPTTTLYPARKGTAPITIAVPRTGMSANAPGHGDVARSSVNAATIIARPAPATSAPVLARAVR